MQHEALLAIDMQMDFCDLPGSALPVPGAVKDIERTVDLVKRRNFSSIFSSLDNHYPLDISHTAWWLDHLGNHPAPFTPIFAEDVENGKYTPVIDPKGSLNYLKALAANGEFIHLLWPNHCIKGTPGQALHPLYSACLEEWSNRNKKWPAFIDKGLNPYTEHFGIFRANVPMVQDSTTNVNQSIINALETFDLIYLLGQAQTHCTANSLRQLLQIAPALAPKLVVVTDCMSPVQGLDAAFYDMVKGIYDNAKSQGVQFETSTNL